MVALDEPLHRPALATSALGSQLDDLAALEPDHPGATGFALRGVDRADDRLPCGIGVGRLAEMERDRRPLELDEQPARMAQPFRRATGEQLRRLRELEQGGI